MDPVKGSSSPGSPGISGAIKDAISAIATTFGPKSLTQAKQRTEKAISQNDGSAGTEDTRIPAGDTQP